MINYIINKLFYKKPYKWIKSEYKFRKEAIFKLNKIKYHICIDEISPKIFDVHFYFYADGKKFNRLLNYEERFTIKNRLINCIDDFLDEYRNDVEFIGFSGDIRDRHELYIMILQKLISHNFICYNTKTDNITFYFGCNKNIEYEKYIEYEKIFIEYEFSHKYETENKLISQNGRYFLNIK